ncbi:MAG: toll/interleukin-1 receptor domain-containing protein [Ruminococcaceae bacterium]|nr:toll/interleukin-1 receptor domain-containing protein [Oscillospiraceae bacterium]
MKKGGCWIFLSHSSQDIDKVRIIRNEFEKYSHNPLAFHLRCLNADTPEGELELDNLIKREIDSREWFVFCDSPAAAQSKYVQMEKRYVIQTGKRKVWSINMSLSIDGILAKVKEICTLIKVYISYTKRDGLDVYNLLSDALIKKDFDVWDSECDLNTGNISIQIFDAIQQTAETGFAVVLITDDYVHSEWCLKELEWIVSSGAKTIPLVFGDVKVPSILDKRECFRIPHIPTETDVNLIVELIEAILESKIIGPIRYQADKFNKIKEIYEILNYEKRYHSQEAVCIHCAGAMDDYIETYKFPCCGKVVVVGDGPISRFRADGCCCDND